jgi:hypothetical protein
MTQDKTHFSRPQVESLETRALPATLGLVDFGAAVDPSRFLMRYDAVRSISSNNPFDMSSGSGDFKLYAVSLSSGSGFLSDGILVANRSSSMAINERGTLDKVMRPTFSDESPSEVATVGPSRVVNVFQTSGPGEAAHARESTRIDVGISGGLQECMNPATPQASEARGRDEAQMFESLTEVTNALSVMPADPATIVPRSAPSLGPDAARSLTSNTLQDPGLAILPIVDHVAPLATGSHGEQRTAQPRAASQGSSSFGEEAAEELEEAVSVEAGDLAPESAPLPQDESNLLQNLSILLGVAVGASDTRNNRNRRTDPRTPAKRSNVRV